MKRRSLLPYLATLTLGATLFTAHAQEAAFPSKTIKIIVGSAPGALTDVATRIYADRMSAFLKQPVVVENMAGASSLLAVRNVAKSAPDGYTLMTVANTFVTAPYVNKAANYNPTKDFTPVGEMVRAPALLVVPGASPYKSIADLVAAAKKAPGGIAYASGGVATTSHLPVELFSQQAGIKFTHVPYKGNAAAIPDLVSGRVAFMMGTATSLFELMKNGSLRALVITSESRSPTFPDLPTFKELGYSDATLDIWIGLFGSAGMPKAVRDKLSAAMEFARKDPVLVKRLEDMGQGFSNLKTPEQFEAFVRQEEVKYRKVIADANIVAE